MASVISSRQVLVRRPAVVLQAPLFTGIIPFTAFTFNLRCTHTTFATSASARRLARRRNPLTDTFLCISQVALLLSITNTHQTHVGCCSSAALRLKNSQDTTAKHTSPARLPLVSRISTSIALRHIFRARPSPSHDHVPRARPTSTSEHVLRARLTAVAARRAFAEHVCGGVAWSGAPVGGRQPPPVTDRAPLSGAGAEQRPPRPREESGAGPGALRPTEPGMSARWR